MKDLDFIATQVVDSAFHISKNLGPGLQEIVYEQVLTRDLIRRDLTVERQKLISFDCDGLCF